MRECRNCLKPFEPEAFEVFCSVDCTSAGNSRNRESSVKGDFKVAIVKESQGWSEDEFQEELLKKAKLLGWSHYHTRDSRKSVAGFPDLTLWRDRVIFAELKDEDGRPSAAQLTVMEGLKAAGAEVYLWKPHQWSEIMEILK